MAPGQDFRVILAWIPTLTSLHHFLNISTTFRPPENASFRRSTGLLLGGVIESLGPRGSVAAGREAVGYIYIYISIYKFALES